MKQKTDMDKEAIRLAIQAGIVASCLVVISGDYSILTIGFQLFVKLLALILGLLSMSYVMLTARLFDFKDGKDLRARKWLYNNSVTFYWYIFATILYYFTGDFFAILLGISPVIVYISTLVIATIVVAILFTVYIRKKKKK